MLKPDRLNFTPEQVESLLTRIESKQLEEGDFPLLAKVIQAMVWMDFALKEKQLSIVRLKSVFGIKTESARKLAKLAGRNVPDDSKDEKENEPANTHESTNEETGKEKGTPADEEEEPPEKQKGHGHRSAEEWKEAKIINITHDSLKRGDLCPKCGNGKLFNLKPGTVLSVSGQPWLQAFIYKPERLRCPSCGHVFTSKLPEEIQTQSRTDANAKAIVTLLKYKGGVPFYRQGKLNEEFGTPLSPTEVFEMTSDVADCLQPIHGALCKLAANAPCICNDDTSSKILDLLKENRLEQPERQGIFTSALLAQLDPYQIALYFTGRQHAGENMNDLLDQRNEESGVPIQMCDALSRNEPKDHPTHMGNCNAHARRKFYELGTVFPKKALYVVSLYDQIFLNDRIAKNLTPSERLQWHQKKSTPVLLKIQEYCHELFRTKQAEPNSSLGKAIQYVTNHWEKLTLFTRMEGVPLSNNGDERLMKSVQRNRKNAYFFKTQEGARIADVLMSIIETCTLNKVNPYHYLVTLQQHKDEVQIDPERWLPWDYLSKGPP